MTCESLRVDTEYVTCLVRFGRVFTGLGVLVLSFGLLRWNILSAWLAWGGIVIGLAAMGVTMLLPDHMSLYMPIFHVQALWMGAVGVAIYRSGVRLTG